MFDSLVVTKTQKPGARSLLSLPAALTLHAVLGLGFVLFSLYAPQALPAPPYRVWVFDPPAIPVTTVNRDQLPGAQETRRDPKPATDNELRAPAETPTAVADAPPAGPPTGSAGPFVEGALPLDLLDPTDLTRQPMLTGPVPVLNPWEVLEPPRPVTQVRPEYPPALRMMGVGGKVVLEVMVDENGDVAQVRVVASPHPMLSQAAEAAVRRWKYTRPVSPAGGSARVLQTVVVDFALR